MENSLGGAQSYWFHDVSCSVMPRLHLVLLMNLRRPYDAHRLLPSGRHAIAVRPPYYDRAILRFPTGTAASKILSRKDLLQKLEIVEIASLHDLLQASHDSAIENRAMKTCTKIVESYDDHTDIVRKSHGHSTIPARSPYDVRMAAPEHRTMSQSST